MIKNGCGDFEPPNFYGPSSISVIEEKPFEHPPGFIRLSEKPGPKEPRTAVNPNCRIRRVTLK